MKLSIVVPVYNVEQYLHQCIDSILHQTFQDFELILVDDGSPDDCPKICDEYAKNDSRIKVIHKTNGGLSSARNAGLQIARGEYISFIDSDDFLDPITYTHVFSIFNKENVDVVIFGRYEVYGKNYVLVGYVDAMWGEIDEEGNHHIYILDFKTSSKSGFSGKGLLDKSKQLLIYAKAVHEMTGVPVDNIHVGYDMMKYVKRYYKLKSGKWSKPSLV